MLLMKNRVYSQPCLFLTRIGHPIKGEAHRSNCYGREGIRHRKFAGDDQLYAKSKNIQTWESLQGSIGGREEISVRERKLLGWKHSPEVVLLDRADSVDRRDIWLDTEDLEAQAGAFFDHLVRVIGVLRGYCVRFPLDVGGNVLSSPESQQQDSLP